MKQLRLVRPCPLCDSADTPKYDVHTSDWCVDCTHAELKRQARFGEARINPETP